MPGLDAARLKKLADETHLKMSGLETEFACASYLHFLKNKADVALWGSSALNLCWIEQPRMLRRLEVANTGAALEIGQFILEREGQEAIRVDVAHRKVEPFFQLEERDVTTPFDELNARFRTFVAEEIICQIILDLVREGGILLAYDLSAIRQVAFDVEAVRRCLLIYLLAHAIVPEGAGVRKALEPLTDADIDRDLAPLLSDRVPMIEEIKFRAWNLAGIFFEYREKEREFLTTAKEGRGDPGLLFPGRPDLVAHPLTVRALARAPEVL